MPASKLMTMQQAIARFLGDGDRLFLGGFIHNEPFAASHEIIRQRKRNLTVSKAAGDIMLDQLVAAGCVAKLIVGYLWNPIPPPKSAHAFRRAVEKGIPHAVEIEDYTVFSLTMAYMAGALGLPFMPIRTLLGTDIANRRSFLKESKVKVIACPFTGQKICLVPALRHDVGILQVQRSDCQGNAQVWGLLGDSKYGINSCDKVIICAEEIVKTDVIQSDPQKTVIPSLKVSAVVHEPWGAHPSYIYGYYGLDLEYWEEYFKATGTLEGTERFLEEWVYSVPNRQTYLGKLSSAHVNGLKWPGRPNGPGWFGTEAPTITPERTGD